MVSEWMVYIAQQPVRCTPFLGRHSATEIKVGNPLVLDGGFTVH